MAIYWNLSIECILKELYKDFMINSGFDSRSVVMQGDISWKPPLASINHSTQLIYIWIFTNVEYLQIKNTQLGNLQNTCLWRKEEFRGNRLWPRVMEWTGDKNYGAIELSSTQKSTFSSLSSLSSSLLQSWRHGLS